MILDTYLEFCDATALNTGAAGTYLLGNQPDTQGTTVASALRDLGTGKSLYLVIQVETGITTAGSAGTVQFKLASDDSASVATNGTATDHVITKAFTTGSTAIPAGTVLACVKLPSEATYERYLGILQVTGTTALNAGKINAFLTDEPARWRALADSSVLGTSL